MPGLAKLLCLYWLVGCASALRAAPHRRCRRALLRDAAALTTLLPLAATALEEPPPMESVDLAAYKKIAGGGRYADLGEGKGPEIAEGSKVSLQWVLRRSNGYYVDGSVKMLSAKGGGAVAVDSNFDEQNNFIFTVGDGQAMPGIDAGVRGMRQGGKRRLVLPVKHVHNPNPNPNPNPKVRWLGLGSAPGLGVGAAREAGAGMGVLADSDSGSAGRLRQIGRHVGRQVSR